MRVRHQPFLNQFACRKCACIYVTCPLYPDVGQVLLYILRFWRRTVVERLHCKNTKAITSKRWPWLAILARIVPKRAKTKACQLWQGDATNYLRNDVSSGMGLTQFKRQPYALLNKEFTVIREAVQNLTSLGDCSQAPDNIT